MPKSFITVLNGVITGKHHGDMDCDFYGTGFYGHDRIEVPLEAEVKSFDRVNFYTGDWKRKSDGQLIDEGLIPMPAGYIREGDTLRKMSLEERIIAGLDDPPPGTRVVDGKVVPMTLEERHDAGLVGDEEYLAVKTAEAEQELNTRLAGLNSEEAKTRAELDEGFAAERKAKLAALLAVKQQEGWPLNIVWPEE
jgi:hypothetical protein